MTKPAAGPLASPESYTPKHLAEKILSSRSALEGERKQVTVFFADVNWTVVVVIAVGSVVLSTLLRFWQETKSNKAADALKAMVSNTATVIRNDMSETAPAAFGRAAFICEQGAAQHAPRRAERHERAHTGSRARTTGAKPL